jgi:hypothetical protein
MSTEKRLSKTQWTLKTTVSDRSGRGGKTRHGPLTSMVVHSVCSHVWNVLVETVKAEIEMQKGVIHT